MIIQSSNKPILVILNDDLSARTVKANLSMYGITMKSWANANMTFYTRADGKHIIELPLTQTETASFKVGVAIFELKWLDAANTTEFSRQVEVIVASRNDRGSL